MQKLILDAVMRLTLCGIRSENTSLGVVSLVFERLNQGQERSITTRKLSK